MGYLLPLGALMEIIFALLETEEMRVIFSYMT